ncbi:uncharacterized protein FIBRA_01755 [Fibroporia radiculosa]|uniref:F-box domain-containing protein n=1 Tax=Fibroporia radiculosa TaxID=599839 RepID=J4G159_9APHY|nr:uncharacterized protein FIBRA_01755 [Fibroporia radiculosa]CCL99733.1 predicted protein [Fibroporia radiculosa]
MSKSASGLLALPPEILERILVESDPLDVAAIAQACSALRRFIYEPADQHLWRSLYLAQSLDDPRECRNNLGEPLSADVDWRARLQRIIRARTVMDDPSKCPPDERHAVLQTLVDLISNIPPTEDALSEDPAFNLAWFARGGHLLDHPAWLTELPPKEEQLKYRLHAHFGLTNRDYRPTRRTESRAYVYAMRNYRWDNEFGPFAHDGSGRVNWQHVWAVHHVMSMHILPQRDLDRTTLQLFVVYPLSLPFCQSSIPRSLDLNKEPDWAGVKGTWQCSFCFCDHRDLLVYNYNHFDHSDTGPMHTAIFDDPDFVEIFRCMDVELRVISTEADPNHPTRPKINFVGTANTNATMVGYVKITPDNQIRWHFKSGEHGLAVWSSEGIQVGGVRSSFGVLGAWTTVQHDRHDPVGAFFD